MKTVNKIIIFLSTVALFTTMAEATCARDVEMSDNVIYTSKTAFTDNQLITKKYATDEINASLCGTISVASITDANGKVPFNGIDYGVIQIGHLAWLDRNLGATTLPSNKHDTTEEYGGFLFQWGRPADGHQLVGSATTLEGIECSDTDVPSHNKFIKLEVDNFPNDWRVTNAADCTGDAGRSQLWSGLGSVNNGVCPDDWRLPTIDEYMALDINSTDDAFDKLKLVLYGMKTRTAYRYLQDVGAYMWTSTARWQESDSFWIKEGATASDPDTGGRRHDRRGNGFAVRCVRDLR